MARKLIIQNVIKRISQCQNVNYNSNKMLLASEMNKPKPINESAAPEMLNWRSYTGKHTTQLSILLMLIELSLWLSIESQEI